MIDAGQVIAYLDLDSTKYTSGIKAAIAAAKDLGNSSLSASAKIKSTGSALTQLGRDASLLTVAIAGIGTAAVASFAKFDDAMRQVWATMDATVEEQQQLVALAKEAALDPDASKDIYDITAGLDALAAAGYDVAKSQAALPTVMLAAQAGNISMAKATDYLAGSMNALNLSVDKLPQFADQISSAAQNSNASIAEMGDAILGVGGYAKQLAGGTVELTTGLGVLADAMIKGSEGGTSLRNIIRALASPEDGAAKVLKDLKVSAYDATTGAFRPLNDTLADLDAALSKLDPEKRAEQMSKIFNAFDLNAAEVLMTSTSGRWDELAASIDASEGSMQKMADTMEGGLGGSIRTLLANLSALGAIAGDVAAPKVEELSDKVGDLIRWFAALPPETQSSIVSIAAWVAAVGPALIVTGKLVSAFGALAPLFTGPAGWITLGIAGTAALALGLNNLYAETSAIDDALSKVSADRLTAYQTAKAKATVDLDVDVDSDGETNVTTAVSKLKAVLKSIDVLTDTERQEILDMIGKDLNPVKSALSAAGLTDGQADAVQGEIDAAVATLRTKLQAMGIMDTPTQDAITTMVGEDRETINTELKKLGLTDLQIGQVGTAITDTETAIREKLGAMNILSQTEINQIIKMVGDDKALIIRQLKTYGLTDTEAEAVATAINEANGKVGGKISSLYDKMYAWLTDGKPDTKEQGEELSKEYQTYYDELIAAVNLDTETKLQSLKDQLDGGFITLEEYQTRADTITEANGTLIANVQQTCADTLTYITTMSNQSTTKVEESLTKMEALKQRGVELAAEIAQLTAEAESAESTRAQNLVKAGVKTDDETTALAFGSAESEFKLGKYGAEQAAKGKRTAVDTQFDSDYKTAQSTGASEAWLQTLKDKHDADVAEIEADLAADTERVQAAYAQTLNELMAGLASQDPEMQAQLQGAMDKLDLAQKLEDALKAALEGGDTSALTGDPIIKGILDQILDPGTDLEKYLADMEERGGSSALSVQIRRYIRRLMGDAETTLSETGGLENSPMAPILQDLLESGLLDGLEGFDATKDRDKLALILGQLDIPQLLADAMEQAYPSGTQPDGAQPEDTQPTKVPVTVEPEVTVADGPETVTEAVQASVTPGEGEESDVSIETPVAITIVPTVTEGSDSALASAFADAISGAADSVSSAATGLSSTAATALGSATGMAKSSGIAMVQGLIDGAESKRSSLVSKFTSLAQAAINAANNKLEVQSPSKVFARIGAYTVAGFVEGVDKNMSSAQASMQRLTKMGAFTPSQITGAGGMVSNQSVVNNNYSGGSAPISITFPGEIHVSDAAEVRSFERKIQRAANDIQYGLGARG